jgi:hypothetical protein
MRGGQWARLKRVEFGKQRGGAEFPWDVPGRLVQTVVYPSCPPTICENLDGCTSGRGGYIPYSSPTMRFRRSCACLICGFLLPTTSALAHRPYERVAATFQRVDGTTISIVRHHVDGIIAADPVSIQFRLPDGTEVAQTPHIFDAVVRPVASGVEVYQFRTTWLPMASRVNSFDGYELKDITSTRRASSFLVHFTGHWVSYLVAGGFAAFFVTLYFGLRAMPKRGWRGALRWVGFAFMALAGSLYAYDILIFEPVSPFVLAGCGAISAALFSFIRRKRHATVC